jgi:Uma2 family endonuclease
MIAHADTYRFSREEYHRLAEVGFFQEDDRVELLDGELVIMAAQGKRHIVAVRRINKILIERFGSVAAVDCQSALIINDWSEPQPDILLLDPSVDAKGEVGRPEDVFVVIEVADSTVRYDSRTKLAAYARAGIREYWIVNLADNTLDVYRQPQGGDYVQKQRFERGASVAPLAFPDRAIDVAEIIP